MIPARIATGERLAKHEAMNPFLKFAARFRGRDRQRREGPVRRARLSAAEVGQLFQAIANYTYDWESWIGSDGRPRWINPADRPHDRVHRRRMHDDGRLSAAAGPSCGSRRGRGLLVRGLPRRKRQRRGVPNRPARRRRAVGGGILADALHNAGITARLSDLGARHHGTQAGRGRSPGRSCGRAAGQSREIPIPRRG